MTMIFHPWIVPSLVGIAFLLPIQPAGAATLTLSPAQDTALFQASPDHNLGGMDFMPVGTTALGDFARGLVRFDLTGQLPADAILVSASLRLQVVLGRPFTSDPHRLYRVLQPWGEGTGTGGGAGTGSLGRPADSGEATWLDARANQASWEDPGTAPDADYSATPSATQNIGDTGSYTFTSSGLLADVALWVAQPEANQGWILIMDDESARPGSARRIGSRENAGASPVLTLIYNLPIRIEGVGVANDRIQFQFAAAANSAYAVEHRMNAGQGAWNLLTNVPAQPAAHVVLVNDSLSSTSRFYRVRGP